MEGENIEAEVPVIWGIDGAGVADLDGNDRPDFATVGVYRGDSPKSMLNILLQDGKGGFHLPQSLPVPIYATRVAAGDLTADGLNDFILLGGGNQVLVMLQSAAAPGAFMKPQFLN